MLIGLEDFGGERLGREGDGQAQANLGARKDLDV